MSRAGASTVLGTLLAVSPAQAAPDTDWGRTCDAISHFAELVAAARDEGHDQARAVVTAQQLLDHPDVLVPEVVREVGRQVYQSRKLSPTKEGLYFRSKCLTPVTPADALVPIQLNVGENRVPTAEGDLSIVLAWQDDGNGHGHDVFSAQAPWAGTVIMPTGTMTITDDPADDQDMRRSIRFASDGRAGAVVMLVAQRDPGRGATPTRLETYRLGPGSGGWRFELVSRSELPRRYCNADAALSSATGLPLRASYRGPRTQDGCPSADGD